MRKQDLRVCEPQVHIIIHEEAITHYITFKRLYCQYQE